MKVLINSAVGIGLWGFRNGVIIKPRPSTNLQGCPAHHLTFSASVRRQRAWEGRGRDSTHPSNDLLFSDWLDPSWPPFQTSENAAAARS